MDSNDKFGKRLNNFTFYFSLQCKKKISHSPNLKVFALMFNYLSYQVY